MSVIRVGSAPLIYSPTVWDFIIQEIPKQSADWAIDALQAFTCNRLTGAEIDLIIAGDVSTSINGESLIITVPAPSLARGPI